MAPDFRWITPMYGFDAKCDHVGVPENARKSLIRMGQDLAETSQLVAIYIPEGVDEVYQAGALKGRIVGGVKLVKMPPGAKHEDYFYDDWDKTRRWPIGWPCEVVFAPPISECPFFREHIEHLYGSFGPYVSRFQHGPFELEQAVRERLNRDFAAFTPHA